MCCFSANRPNFCVVWKIRDTKKNSVNADIASAYTVDPAVVSQRCGFELIERFNSGLGVIHKQSLNLDWLEEFLTLPDIIGHFLAN